MGKSLIATRSVEIAANALKVWDILTQPEFIRQWDDVPEYYEGGALALGSVLEWKGDASTTKLTVCEHEPLKYLEMRLYSSSWEMEEDAYNIAYRYILESNSPESCTLTIEVGDFVELPDGEDYYDASVDFVDTAANKIKSMAESAG